MRDARASTRPVCRLVAVLVASLAVGTACGRTPPAAPSASSGCGPFEGTLEESSEFTPYDDMLTHLPPTPLAGGGAAAGEIPTAVRLDSLGGLARRHAIVTPDRDLVAQYFADEPLGDDTTVVEFQEGGGLQLEAVPLEDSGMTVDELAASLGPRGVRVRVGDSRALVVHADPEGPSSQRMHHVYWADDDYQYTLIGRLGAEEAVTLARGITCR